MISLRKPFTYSYTNVVVKLIIINSVLFIVKSFFPVLEEHLDLVPFFVIKRRAFWQVFTYQFMHSDFRHVFLNMCWLFFFGIPVERRLGSKEFLLYYLLAGTICGILCFLVYICSGRYWIHLKGASADIFAITLLYSVLYPRSVLYLFGLVPIPVPLFIIAYVILELVSIGANDGISHLGHFFGFLVGWFYIVIRFGLNPIKVWNDRK